MAEVVYKSFVKQADTYTTTASGTTVDVSKATPMMGFAVLVKGTGGAATSWTVVVEGSLDNTNFQQIGTHTNTGEGDAVTKTFLVNTPYLYFRSRCTAVTLGGATNIIVTILAFQGVTRAIGQATMANSLSIAMASDQGAIAALGQGATGASVPSGAVYNGVRGTTALPTAVTDGQLAGAMADKFGRLIVIPQAFRDLVSSQTTTINSSTGETTIISAGGAGVFNDLISLIFINTSASATRVDLRDATSGTIIGAFYLPAGDTRGVAWNVPLPQTTAANNWTITCGTSVSDIRVLAQYVKNK